MTQKRAKHLRGIDIDAPRICTACGELKPADAFSRKSARLRSRKCKPCVSARNRAARQAVARLSRMERERLYGKQDPHSAEFDAFWSRVNKRGECWLWTGTLSRKGYGNLSINIAGLAYWKAHRVSWAIHKGEIPQGMHVLHRCDNPWCVNPDHLYLGTNQDNVNDKKRRGRQLCGERMNTSKLTPDEVQAIRLSDEPPSVLARHYGIDSSNIVKIKDGRSWKHLPFPDGTCPV